MANRTNASAPYYSYEYYLDYLDLIPVDEKKLKANKRGVVQNTVNGAASRWKDRLVKCQCVLIHLIHQFWCHVIVLFLKVKMTMKDSIVIAFWVSLVAFVMLLFLILLCVSWSGSPQERNGTQNHPKCPWSPSLSLPLCLRRVSMGTAEEPGSGAGTDQRL